MNDAEHTYNSLPLLMSLGGIYQTVAAGGRRVYSTDFSSSAYREPLLVYFLTFYPPHKVEPSDSTHSSRRPCAAFIIKMSIDRAGLFLTAATADITMKPAAG